MKKIKDMLNHITVKPDLAHDGSDYSAMVMKVTNLGLGEVERDVRHIVARAGVSK